MTTVPIAPAPPVAPLLHGRHRPVQALPRRSRTRRVLRVFSGVFLGLVALAAILGATAVIVLKIGFSPVLSPSMEPTFHPGDLVLTRAMPAASVKVGDVVVLPRPDMPGERYAHRVVSVRTEDGLPVVRTKGDANEANDPDELRITSDVVPTVIGAVPRVGEIALAGSRAPVRIALLVLIGGAVLLAAKRGLWRKP